MTNLFFYQCESHINPCLIFYILPALSEAQPSRRVTLRDSIFFFVSFVSFVVKNRVNKKMSNEPNSKPNSHSLIYPFTQLCKTNPIFRNDLSFVACRQRRRNPISNPATLAILPIKPAKPTFAKVTGNLKLKLVLPVRET